MTMNLNKKPFIFIVMGIVLLIIIVSVLNIYKIPDKSQISDKSGLNSLKTVNILCSTDYGYVEMGGPYGNQDSPVKVAYIVGVHPMESNAHKAIMAVLANEKSLKYCYYVYNITVTKDAEDYDKGRIKGQNLANKYALPDIIAKNASLAVDVHSNRGSYQEMRFVDVPVDDNLSKSYAFEMVNKTPWLTYYIPPLESGPTSGPYVSIPLIESGIPTMVYETYMYESYEITFFHAKEFVENLDKMVITLKK
jgi:hypothetical protein